MLFKESLRKIAVSGIYTTHFILKASNTTTYIKTFHFPGTHYLFTLFFRLFVRLIVLYFISQNIRNSAKTKINSYFQIFIDNNTAGVWMGQAVYRKSDESQWSFSVSSVSPQICAAWRWPTGLQIPDSLASCYLWASWLPQFISWKFFSKSLRHTLLSHMFLMGRSFLKCTTIL